MAHRRGTHDRKLKTAKMDHQLDQQKLTTLYIIHGSLLGTLFVYSGIGWFISRQSEPPMETEEAMLIFWCFVGVSIMAISFGFLFRKLKLQPSALTDDPQEVKEALENYTIGFIIQDGLFESVGIYGLVMTLLTHDLKFVLSFSAVALVLLLIFHPSRSDFESRLQKIRRK